MLKSWWSSKIFMCRRFWHVLSVWVTTELEQQNNMVTTAWLYLVKNSCYGNIDAPISYFTNPAYPDKDWVPNYCTYTVKVNFLKFKHIAIFIRHFQISDPDVCQLRLDFDDFRISGPSLVTSPFGKCTNDRFAIFSSQQQELGLSEGNLICGDMTAQHSMQHAKFIVANPIVSKRIQFQLS